MIANNNEAFIKVSLVLIMYNFLALPLLDGVNNYNYFKNKRELKLVTSRLLKS